MHICNFKKHPHLFSEPGKKIIVCYTQIKSCPVPAWLSQHSCQYFHCWARPGPGCGGPAGRLGWEGKTGLILSSLWREEELSESLACSNDPHVGSRLMATLRAGGGTRGRHLVAPESLISFVPIKSNEIRPSQAQSKTMWQLKDKVWVRIIQRDAQCAPPRKYSALESIFRGVESASSKRDPRWSPIWIPFP